MEPLEVVLSFIEEMNDWEQKMYLVARREAGQAIRASDRARMPDETYGQFKQVYHVVFDRYCTQRERTYGGQPSSWSEHGKYQGGARDTVESVDLVRKNRAEVVVRAGQFPNNRFKFVLLLAHGQWRIDSAKYGGPGDWQTHHL